MNRQIPLNEMTYQELVSHITSRISIEDEVFRWYIGNISDESISKNGGFYWDRWRVSVDQAVKTKIDVLYESEARLDLLKRVYVVYVKPYLEQFGSPARKMSEAYCLIMKIGKGWGMSDDEILYKFKLREKLVEL